MANQATDSGDNGSNSNQSGEEIEALSTLHTGHGLEGHTKRRDKGRKTDRHNKKPIRITSDNDGKTKRKCMVLNAPIRRWNDLYRDFTSCYWRTAGPRADKRESSIGKGVQP